MVNRVKNFVTYRPSLITMHNLVVVSHTVGAHIGGFKILGDAEARPLGIAAWLTTRNTSLSYICYHTKFGRSRSNCMGVGRSPKNFGDSGAPSLLIGALLIP